VRYQFAGLPIIRALKALANLSVSLQPQGQMSQTQALRAPETPKEGTYLKTKNKKSHPTIDHAWPTEWNLFQ
jgi:hypothetical protein